MTGGSRRYQALKTMYRFGRSEWEWAWTMEREVSYSFFTRAGEAPLILDRSPTLFSAAVLETSFQRR